MQDIDFRNDLLPLKNQLFRLALRITLDRPEAEDVTEETLIRVWEKRAKLGNIKSLEAYCLTVCRNLALDRKERKEAQNISLDQDTFEATDLSPTPDEQLENADRLHHIHRLFNELPERQRTILQLRDIEGKSYREIAQTLETTEEVVKVTLFRARKNIKTKYESIDHYGL